MAQISVGFYISLGLLFLYFLCYIGYIAIDDGNIVEMLFTGFIGLIWIGLNVIFYKAHPLSDKL